MMIFLSGSKGSEKAYLTLLVDKKFGSAQLLSFSIDQAISPPFLVPTRAKINPASVNSSP
jgi:hypothetical protein